MKSFKTQSGFAHVAILVLVLVFAVIGVIGYRLYANQSAAETSQTFTAPTTAKVPTAAPQIKSASDLDTASNVLDAGDTTAISNNDSAALDSQMSALN
jgi:hypothetical protein